MYDYFHGGQYIPNHWKEHQVEKMIFDTIFMYLVYILFVPILVVFVTILVRIYSQGTSKDLKKLVRNRHGAYFCVYMLYVAFIIIDFRGNNMSHEYELWVAVASTSCGSVLAAVRLSEPYVWVEFRKYLICLKKSKSHDKFSAESLDTFIKSACNAEYVYFSLAGLITSTQDSSKAIIKLESYFVSDKTLYNVTVRESLEEVGGSPLMTVQSETAKSCLNDSLEVEIVKEIRDKDQNVLFRLKQSVVGQDEIQMKCTLWNHKNYEFKQIREAHGISDHQIAQSLDLDKNINKIFLAGKGSGRSGSFFFYSFDNNLIIKTIQSSEKQLLLKTIDDISSHTLQTKNKSLLSRIYGIYSIKTAQFAKVSFVLMENIIKFKQTKSKRMIFDIKGSQMNRYVKVPPAFWRKS